MELCLIGILVLAWLMRSTFPMFTFQKENKMISNPKTFPLYDPFMKLLYSRKFLITITDIVVSTVLYFSIRYLAPTVVEDVRFLVAALQPVALMLIYAIAKEDAAQATANAIVELNVSDEGEVRSVSL